MPTNYRDSGRPGSVVLADPLVLLVTYMRDVESIQAMRSVSGQCAGTTSLTATPLPQREFLTLPHPSLDHCSSRPPFVDCGVHALVMGVQGGGGVKAQNSVRKFHMCWLSRRPISNGPYLLGPPGGGGTSGRCADQVSHCAWRKAAARAPVSRDRRARRGSPSSVRVLLLRLRLTSAMFQPVVSDRLVRGCLRQQ